MPVKLENNWNLREKILEGVNILTNYVETTLGPKGQNVLIHKKGANPFVTKDGVTVAQNMSFDDPFINAGAEIVKQASAMTNIEAGDGTTTSTILAREILNQAHKHITAGSSPIEIKRGLDQCLEVAVKIISDASRPISSIEDITHVATLSANNDLVIGELISTAVDRVGKNGSITIEDARSHETSLDLVEGFRFPSGLAARAFVTDDRRGVCKYDNPMFMITDYNIEQVSDILPALEIAAREGRPFVIVADEIEGQALAALIMNSIRGSMKVAAIKAPFYGEERRNAMSDLATALGATFIQRSMGQKISDVDINDFGSADMVEVSKHTTTIVGGFGSSEQIANTIEKIQLEIEETDDLREAARLQDRITRLNSGVAIIKVGASTEVEMVEKRHRIEDALEAVRAAQQEGVVLGGGMTYIKIAAELAVNFDNEEQSVALPIFKTALEAPFRAMAKNSGLSPDVATIQAKKCDNSEGINFVTSNQENLLLAGVIDPAKVSRCALKNAVSVAGTLLLTNHSIVET